MSNQNSDDLFDILDKSIDDLKDLPGFKVPDTGMYKLTVTAGMKEINKKAAVTTSYVVREVLELEDSEIPEEDWAKTGDKFDVPFILKNDDGTTNEFAEGRLKEFLAPFHAHFDEKNIKALLKGPLAAGVDITAKVKKVARKNDDEKFDARISEITID
jgi:hypothetical protein